MRIKKIKLVQDGLKGADIVYEKTDDKDGKSFITPVKEEPRYPIHLGLEKKFKELREYYAEILGLLAGKLGDNEIKYIINGIDITGVSMGHDWFLITGKINTFCDKKVGIPTPKIDESDEFHAYKKVMEIIGEILAETADYMSGAKKFTNEDLGRRLIERQLKLGNESISIDEFESKTADEKKDFCTQYLEKNCNSMVTHYDDLVIDEENATILDLQKVG